MSFNLSSYAGKTLKVDITTNSSAAYNNNIGFILLKIRSVLSNLAMVASSNQVMLTMLLKQLKML